MSATLRLDGLDDLQQQLHQLPEDLVEEASGIVRETADAAARQIIATYPTRTGDLKKYVRVTHRRTWRGVVSTVINPSPLAHIFELGTQARHTKLGATRGSMPPGHVFSRVVPAKRREMWESLKAMLVTHGLIVSDDAG